MCMHETKRAPGRPRGKATTRPAILSAARECFLALGYERTTLRAIAREAGVDVSTVVHHFGAKHELFVAALAVKVGPAGLLRQALRDTTQPPHRAIAVVLTRAWSDEELRRPVERVLAAALTDERVRDACRSYIDREVLQPLTDSLRGADASARAAAIVSVAAGAFLTRFALGVRGGSDERFQSALETQIGTALYSPPTLRGAAAADG